MSATDVRDPQDLAQLAERGIAPAEARRQLEVLARPAAWAVLERPCTIGDGIEQLSPERVEELLEAHAQVAKQGRVSAFVPASGAATRMFKDLAAALETLGTMRRVDVRAEDSPAARTVARYMEALPRFAFAHEVRGVLAIRGEDAVRLRELGHWRLLVEALLGTDGLDAPHSPKGLLPFHREAGQVRTAFEEHLVEACALASDANGVRRLDVTVSPEHRDRFERKLAEVVPRLAATLGGSWRVRFSEQHPATDTIAGDPAGGPFRNEYGRLLFRPAGHGALLRNLAESEGDLVFLKNIDNVAVSRLRPESERWSRALVGLVSELDAGVRKWCAKLEEEWDDFEVLGGARSFAQRELGLSLDAFPDSQELRTWLDRPIRVCGMVANTGEPGGGPFWMREDPGVTRQIVESAQVNVADPGQAETFRQATHFNPVFLAASLRDHHGRLHDLARFVDESAVIVTRKSHGGRELLALERPGLWNGAMARWHTRFVEVPLLVFNPVKTVFDLLRPEHQGD